MNRRGFFGRLSVLSGLVVGSKLPEWTPKHKARDGDSWVWRQGGYAQLTSGEFLEVKGGWFKPAEWTARGPIMEKGTGN